MEADQNIIMWLQRNKIPVDDYKRESKYRVELCEAAGLSPGATEVAVKIVAEEENLAYSLLADNNIKEYLKKGGEQWHATLHFLGLNSSRASKTPGLTQ